MVKNRLGLPVSVRHSEMFSPVGKQSDRHTVRLQDGESLGMDYSVTTQSDQFSAMTSLSEKHYYIQPGELPATLDLDDLYFLNPGRFCVSYRYVSSHLATKLISLFVKSQTQTSMYSIRNV